MIPRILSVVFVFMALCQGGHFLSFASHQSAPEDTFTASDRLVMASYYPWYGHKNPRWGEEQGIDHPLAGSYNSSDPKLIDYHCTLAQEAGLDAFLVSWSGAGNIYDQRFRQMLVQIRNATHYPHFKLGIYYERVANSPKMTNDQVIADFAYLLRKYGHHPAFLRVAGKPVIFVYDPQTLEFPRWKTILDAVSRDHGPAFFVAAPNGWDIPMEYLTVFDSIAPYADKYYSDEAILKEYAHVGKRGKKVIATLFGGGSPIQKLGFDIDRSGGKYLRHRFDLAAKGKAQWLYITSWNEWFESMQIEPSREYEFESIKNTRVIAAKFKNVPVKPRDKAALAITRKRLNADTVTVTVTNTGRHNIYCVTCKSEKRQCEHVAYVLRPGEKGTVSVRSIWPSPRIEVIAYLADNTKLRQESGEE